jgi:hypothetical protein
MPLPGPGSPRAFSDLNQNIPAGGRASNTANSKLSDFFPLYPDSNQSAPHAISEIIVVEHLSSFDFLQLKYSWDLDAGNDLDTFTGFINTGTIYDSDWVGFGQGDANVPAGSGTPYLTWGGDITTAGGSEAILVNIARFNTENPTTTSNIIEIKMNAVWYSGRNTGNVDVVLTTWTGGTMVYNGTTKDWTNSGGTLVQNISLSTNVATQSTASNISTSDSIAQFLYNKTTDTATIQLL